MNVPPLQLAPQYATDANGGVAKSRYWPDKPTGIGDHIAGRMGELVVAVNEIFNSRTWFEMVVKRKWPGARVALFDVNGLVRGFSSTLSTVLLSILSSLHPTLFEETGPLLAELF
jgi:hypothetical protein